MSMEDDLDLYSGIFPGQAAQHLSDQEVGHTKQFAPWHMPRKMWVRFNQWGKECERLIRNLHISDRPFRYLSLPGDDLIDIRILSHTCNQNSIKLKFLGFNQGMASPNRVGTSELNISSNEVKALNNIHRESFVYDHNVLDLENPHSMASIRFKESGDFDAINLDLCGSLDADQNRGNERFHKTLSNIIHFQNEKRSEPWMLFITTRADRQTVPLEYLARYWTHIGNNVRASQEFRQKLERLTQSDFESFHWGEETFNSIQPDNFTKLFNLGLAKWLLKYATSCQPKISVQMLNSTYYRVGEVASPNMLSLAFRISQHNAHGTDTSGILPPTSTKECELDEVALGNFAADKVLTLKDLDVLLRDDAKLREIMLRKTKPILKTARYPADDYDEWASGREAELKYTTDRIESKT